MKAKTTKITTGIYEVTNTTIPYTIEFSTRTGGSWRTSEGGYWFICNENLFEKDRTDSNACFGKFSKMTEARQYITDELINSESDLKN